MLHGSLWVLMYLLAPLAIPALCQRKTVFEITELQTQRAVVRTGLKEQSLSWEVSLALALSKQRLVMQDKKSQYVLCRSVYMCMSLGLHTHL